MNMARPRHWPRRLPRAGVIEPRARTVTLGNREEPRSDRASARPCAHPHRHRAPVPGSARTTLPSLLQRAGIIPGTSSTARPRAWLRHATVLSSSLVPTHFRPRFPYVVSWDFITKPRTIIMFREIHELKSRRRLTRQIRSMNPCYENVTTPLEVYI